MLTALLTRAVSGVVEKVRATIIREKQSRIAQQYTLPSRSWILTGAVLGDVGQPDLVGGLSGELAVDAVVVDRGSGFPVQSSLLGEDRPDVFLRAQPGDPVLAGDDPAPGEFIGDEAVPERWVVAVDVVGRVDQMGIVPATL